MKNNYIPSDIKCFWCNGHMRQQGVIAAGSGLNYINYFCQDCGGIAHFAKEDDGRPIKNFKVTYDRDMNYWIRRGVTTEDTPVFECSHCKNYIHTPRGMRLPYTCPSCSTKMENGGERF